MIDKKLRNHVFFVESQNRRTADGRRNLSNIENVAKPERAGRQCRGGGENGLNARTIRTTADGYLISKHDPPAHTYSYGVSTHSRNIICSLWKRRGNLKDKQQQQRATTCVKPTNVDENLGRTVMRTNIKLSRLTRSLLSPPLKRFGYKLLRWPTF